MSPGLQEAGGGRDAYVEAGPLAPVPQTHNTVVGGTRGQQVVPIGLQAVQRAVVGLLPLHDAFPVPEEEMQGKLQGRPPPSLPSTSPFWLGEKLKHQIL